MPKVQAKAPDRSEAAAGGSPIAPEAEVFGDYLLHERIGSGGMAEIFLATSPTTEAANQRLAIKRILPTYSDDEQFVRMLVEEAKLCADLRHPNIVDVYDLGEIEHQYFIAMEYVDGHDLLKTLAACGRNNIGFPTDIALYIVMEVLKGLEYAHRLSRPDGHPYGIIHRDVSPSNILLSFEGDVKIGDFGIAKATTREKTSVGTLKGKFGYMAPEQVTGSKIDHRADVFAAGIVLFELLTGHRLFSSKNDIAVLERIRDAVIHPPPRHYRPDLDPDLERIVLKALARRTQDRFQSAQELHDELYAYVYGARAQISPGHLGRFMQNLFLRDPEEQSRRARVGLAPLRARRLESLERPTMPPPVPSISGATEAPAETEDTFQSEEEPAQVSAAALAAAEEAEPARAAEAARAAEEAKAREEVQAAETTQAARAAEEAKAKEEVRAAEAAEAARAAETTEAARAAEAEGATHGSGGAAQTATPVSDGDEGSTVNAALNPPLLSSSTEAAPANGDALADLEPSHPAAEAPAHPFTADPPVAHDIIDEVRRSAVEGAAPAFEAVPETMDLPVLGGIVEVPSVPALIETKPLTEEEPASALQYARTRFDPEGPPAAMLESQDIGILDAPFPATAEADAVFDGYHVEEPSRPVGSGSAFGPLKDEDPDAAWIDEAPPTNDQLAGEATPLFPLREEEAPEPIVATPDQPGIAVVRGGPLPQGASVSVVHSAPLFDLGTAEVPETGPRDDPTAADFSPEEQEDRWFRDQALEFKAEPASVLAPEGMAIVRGTVEARPEAEPASSRARSEPSPALERPVEISGVTEARSPQPTEGPANGNGAASAPAQEGQQQKEALRRVVQRIRPIKEMNHGRHVQDGEQKAAPPPQSRPAPRITSAPPVHETAPPPSSSGRFIPLLLGMLFMIGAAILWTWLPTERSPHPPETPEKAATGPLDTTETDPPASSARPARSSREGALILRCPAPTDVEIQRVGHFEVAGYFRKRLAPGRYRVRLERDGKVLKRKRVEISLGTDVDLPCP